MKDSNDLGGARQQADPALVSDQAPAGLAASRFDPSRRDELEKALAREEMVMAALTDAYQRRRLAYLHFSPAYDATAARAAALSWLISDSDRSGEADETGTGSAGGESAGPQDIAQPSQGAPHDQ